MLELTVGCVLLVLLRGDRSLWTVSVGACIGLAAAVATLPFVRSDLSRGWTALCGGAAGSATFD